MSTHLTNSEMSAFAQDRLPKKKHDAADKHLQSCSTCFRSIRTYLKAVKEKPVAPCAIFDTGGHSLRLLTCTACGDTACTSHVRTVQQFFAEQKAYDRIRRQKGIGIKAGYMCTDCYLDLTLMNAEVMITLLGGSFPEGDHYKHASKLLGNLLIKENV